MLRYRVGGVTVEIDQWGKRVFSRWDDGVTLEAAPVEDEASITRARELGYVAPAGQEAELVWLMTADHDLLHHVLAAAVGAEAGSPHLRRVATGEELDELAKLDGHREECLVMLLHRMLNMGDDVLDGYRLEDG